MDQTKNVTVRTFHTWPGIVHEHIFFLARIGEPCSEETSRGGYNSREVNGRARRVHTMIIVGLERLT